MNNQKSYSKPDQMYFDTLDEINSLNKKIHSYHFRELKNVSNDKEYNAWLNKLHKDIRGKMSDMSLEEAKDIASKSFDRFKELQTTLSCLRIVRGSLYGKGNI